MPIYSFNMIVPANTEENAPTRQRIVLSPGKIVQVSVGFPLNAAAQLNLGIAESGKILWPSNPDQWFAWEKEVFVFPENYALASSPPALEMVGWNTDDAFAHTGYFWFAVIPFTKEEIEAIFGRPKRKKLLGVFG